MELHVGLDKTPALANVVLHLLQARGFGTIGLSLLGNLFAGRCCAKLWDLSQNGGHTLEHVDQHGAGTAAHLHVLLEPVDGLVVRVADLNTMHHSQGRVAGGRGHGLCQIRRPLVEAHVDHGQSQVIGVLLADTVDHRAPGVDHSEKRPLRL